MRSTWRRTAARMSACAGAWSVRGGTDVPVAGLTMSNVSVYPLSALAIAPQKRGREFRRRAARVAAQDLGQAANRAAARNQFEEGVPRSDRAAQRGRSRSTPAPDRQPPARCRRERTRPCDCRSPPLRSNHRVSTSTPRHSAVRCRSACEIDTARRHRRILRRARSHRRWPRP